MNKSIVAGFSAIALWAAVPASPACAADIYRAPSMKEPVVAPVFTWTGLYVGAHVGGAWGNLDVTDVDGYLLPLGNRFSSSPEGVFGGGTLGYNVQSGSIVFGIEGDLGGMDLHQTVVQPGSPGGDTIAQISGGLYGDITGRLGLAAGPVLFYAKGGAAFFDGRLSVADVCVVFPCGIQAQTTNGSDTLTGWTAGGGIEYMIGQSWSLKAEYLHFDFGSQTLTFVGPGGGNGFRWENDLTVDTVKIGLNCRASHGFVALQ